FEQTRRSARPLVAAAVSGIEDDAPDGEREDASRHARRRRGEPGRGALVDRQVGPVERRAGEPVRWRRGDRRGRDGRGRAAGREEQPRDDGEPDGESGERRAQTAPAPRRTTRGLIADGAEIL